MTIYVESNFVLEIALGQEQSEAAEAILNRAERRGIALALPAFALSEPFSTVAHRSRRLQHLHNQLAEQLRELSRSIPHQEDVQALASMPALMASIERRERERLISTVGRLYAAGIIIPINAPVYGEAVAIMERLRLSPQDAMIYASVLDHIRTGDQPGPHFFINKNWKDFEDPAIEAELGTLNCMFLRSFVDAESRLDQSAHG